MKELLLIKDLPTVCAQCGASLCLRKQVINLALGNDSEMSCLACLSLSQGHSQEDILDRLKQYVQTRDCFKKQWIRYELSHCPDPDGCFPGVCFK